MSHREHLPGLVEPDIDPPRWSRPLVMDVASSMLTSLATDGYHPDRAALVRVLAAAAIAPGEIR